MDSTVPGGPINVDIEIPQYWIDWYINNQGSYTVNAPTVQYRTTAGWVGATVSSSGTRKWTANLGNLSDVLVDLKISMTDNLGNSVLYEVDDGFYVRSSSGEPAVEKYLPYAIDTSAYRSNIAFQNVGTAPANIIVYFYTPSGSLHAQKQLESTVPVNGFTQVNNVIRWVKGTSSQTNLTGYLKIVSDQPILTYVSLNDNTTSDPSCAMGITPEEAYMEGFIPVILNNGTAWNSHVVITNIGASNATVTLTAYNASGNIAVTYTVPGGLNVGAQWDAADIGATIGLPEAHVGLLRIKSTQPIMTFVWGYTNSHTGASLPGVSIII